MSWEHGLPKRLVKKLQTLIFIASLNALVLLWCAAATLAFYEQYFWASGVMLLNIGVLYPLSSAAAFWLHEWEVELEQRKKQYARNRRVRDVS